MKPAAKIMTGVVLIAAIMSITNNARAATALEAQARLLDAAAAQRNPNEIAERVAAPFATFAGSSANALNLVKGMRSGKVIALRTEHRDRPAELVAFNAANGPLEWGDVHAALSVAQSVLARNGITRPTGAQIQAALIGGKVTTDEGNTFEHEGVLKLRHMGAPWDRIAQASGARSSTLANGIVKTQAKLLELPMEYRIATFAGHDLAGVASATEQAGLPIYSMPASMNLALVTPERTPSAWGRYTPTERKSNAFEKLPGIR